MTKSKAKIRILTGVIALVMMVSSIFTVYLSASGGTVDLGSSPSINQYGGSVDTGYKDFLNGSVMYQLPDSVGMDQELSLIVMMKDTESVLDRYESKDPGMTFSEYATTSEAEAIRKNVSQRIDALDAKLGKTDAVYSIGAQYDTVISGFEVIALASEYKTICKALGDDAVIVIGEEYEAAKSELVENKVDVNDTGIFNSDGFSYNGISLNGSGTLVAVLDTGLDYYHNAFKDSNFAKYNSGNYALTFDDVTELVNGSDFTAEMLQSGLTASDVYISNKVPYAFDYADGDSDVYPLLSNHGTHVAGIIAGHAPEDNGFVGVAPGAQLAIFKIFSDVMSTARSAWILNALEDCVTLGVDVINMSIGTSCGFSTETDQATLESKVYDRIREQGISLVVAASNDFNSTYGSEKNGNLGLTSNPDSATVGSPGSYLGALSVASIQGVKTPYLLYKGSIVYFTESTDKYSEEKHFVEDLFKQLGGNKTSVEMTYVTVPGVGYTADYRGLNVKGKIALVRRGDSTFEEKVAVAEAQGAIGVIVYNNVSGDIKMNVGDSDLPVCSISQDDGEELAKVRTGKIKISTTQLAGPFMSDFSSWGPTPDLKLKPDITAHGGSILSSVPGNSYDRISGTSMATPNVSGLTALLRQYVIERFGFDPDTDTGEITNTVNRLMMSTADIIINKNGTPYSVRKQGAGLSNLTNSAKSDAYIITYEKGEDGNFDTEKPMDKSKIELGDDPNKTGNYTLVFTIKNFGSKSLSYNMSSYVLTEGVSETKTSHGDTTVTETSYILDGAKVSITSVENGTRNGNKITVDAGSEATITVNVALSNKDKKYLDSSFENGMYVEGYIVLDAVESDSVDMSVPYLAFYGDWTVAPQLDLDYFQTNKDELDDSIDMEDKTLPDAYASRPVGGTEGDYVSFLGSYYFVQKPGATQIAADKKYIAISNQQDTINSLRFVWAGLLRNAKKVVTTITDDATGEVVFETVDTGVRKSYSSGLSIYPANIDIEFSAIENNLKNNSSYTVTVQTFLDYGEDGGASTNKNNTFTFPLVTDFEAPSITDVEFYTEYDRSAKKTRLFAKVAVYDNHYSMSMQVGYIVPGTDTSVFHTFDKYMTPIYSSQNSTSYVTYELTDYIEEIKSSQNKNSFVISVYDYAINNATYEIALPDEYTDFYFAEEDTTINSNGNTVNLALSPNETYTLAPVVFPNTEWAEFIEYTSSNQKVARVVGNKLLAIAPGYTQITATFTENGVNRSATMMVRVMDKGESLVDSAGKKYKYTQLSAPVADTFSLTGYYTDYAFYHINTDERDIGETGSYMKFGGSYSLSMYPSESVTLMYKLIAFFPDATEVVFKSGNKSIATIDEKTGRITAVSEGLTNVTISVLMNGQSTYYSQTVTVEVKDPFINSGPILTSYFGSGTNNGGKVYFPPEMAITEIGQFAFSNYDYVAKDPSEIFPGDTDTMKPWFLGNDNITHVTIPEGVERIGPYAFANLRNLKSVTLPSTLETIDYGAFYNCYNLETVEGLEHVKFINQSAFEDCHLKNIKLDSAVAIANYAFAITPEDDTSEVNLAGTAYFSPENPKIIPKLTSVTLPESIQSVGAYAFYGNTALTSFTIEADIVKLGQYAFSECTSLNDVRFNAAVIPTGLYHNCKSLSNITLGPDVAVVGEYAFYGTKVAEFTVEAGNTTFTPGTNPYIANRDTILLVAPEFGGIVTGGREIVAVANGAFSGNTKIKAVCLPYVTSVGNYAFSECTSLSKIELGTLTYIGDFAFENTAITAMPNIDFANLEYFGSYSFARTNVRHVYIPDGDIEWNEKTKRYENTFTVPMGAFLNCPDLEIVVIGSFVNIGAYAFATDATIMPLKEGERYWTDTDSFPKLVDGKIKNVYYYNYYSPIRSLTIGRDANIGHSAFLNASELYEVTLGENAVIGSYAFYNAGTHISGIDENGQMISKSFRIDLSGARSIGAYAFSGPIHYMWYIEQVPDSSSVLGFTDMMYYLYDDDGNPIYAFHTPKIESVDLSNAISIGRGAFEFSVALESVKLGESVSSIGANAFYQCGALTSVNLENVETIGNEAFANTTIKHVDLSSVLEIGAYAFCYNNSLVSVKFGDNGIKIGEGAFTSCESLTKLIGEENVKEIDDYAFALTGVVEADLSGIEVLGTQAFYKTVYTPFSLVLGTGIKEIGDNPFAYCDIQPISRLENDDEARANGHVFRDGVDGKEKIYHEITYTFDLYNAQTGEYNDFIRIIDGSIYQKVPNGYTLITWTGTPIATIPEGTVKISAMAFAGSDVSQVVIPSTIKSIGHKAFYECLNLSYVAFRGVKAPILEEEYDEMYWMSAEHIAASGIYQLDYTDGSTVHMEGLGIVPFFIWNATSNPTNTFYGANFVDYVGLVGMNGDKGFESDVKLTMVRPTNGVGYDTFIFSNYFDVIINAQAAAEEATLAAIEAISLIPDSIKRLSDKVTVNGEQVLVTKIVAEARAAYDKVVSLEQRALITDLLRLTDAEKIIKRLSGNSGSTVKPTPTPTPTPTPEPEPTPDPELTPDPAPTDKDSDGSTVVIVIISVIAVLLLAALITVSVLLIKTKGSEKKKKVKFNFGGQSDES